MIKKKESEKTRRLFENDNVSRHSATIFLKYGAEFNQSQSQRLPRSSRVYSQGSEGG